MSLLTVLLYTLTVSHGQIADPQPDAIEWTVFDSGGANLEWCE